MRITKAISYHFTLDRGLPGPDHKASLEPEELAAMMCGVREIEAARGDGHKRPRSAEIPLRAVAHKNLHAARDLPVGHVLGPGDLLALRPGSGVPPSALARVTGARLTRARSSFKLLDEAALE